MTRLLRQPGWFWLACLAVVLLASILGRPDIPIDETRYVSVAWEMWNSGDWLVMHRNGEPYHHKPPLLFWLIGAGWQVFGVNGWWPRAISALCSLACLGLTIAVARRLWPQEEAVGQRAGWIVLGTVFWLFFSASVIFDILLTVFVLLALLAALRAWCGERRGTWGLFGVAIGLGILAKGPVVLLHVLPPLLLAPLWGGRGRFGRSWYGGIGLGVLLGAAIALTWAIPAAIRGGEEFRNAIFWGQTAGRVTGNLAHKQPLWFYFAILPVLLFPWLFWGGAWRALIHAIRQRQDTGVRFCLAWIIPVFLGFSLAGGKQAHYLLPLLPAFALLPAFGWRRVGWVGRRAGVALALTVAAFGLVLFVAPGWASRLWLAPYVGNAWQMSGAALVMLAVVSLLTTRGDAALPRVSMASVALVVILLLGVLRPLWPVFDMTPLALRLQALEAQGVPVAHASAYNDQYHFYGRLTQPLDQIARNEVGTWLAAHPDGRVVIYLKRASDADVLQPEFSQPYLDGAVALVGAESAARLPGIGQ